MLDPVDSIRVLHVDDDPDFAEVAATFLEREDDRLDVRTAANAEQGAEILAEEDIDCVVSDYDMPVRNGVEFLERIRGDHPSLPFILYTGKGSEEVASKAISAGVTDYLQKGSGTSQYAVLANRISNAVEATQSATEAKRRQYRLEQILKTVPGCVVQLDADGQFVFANERAEEVLGLESDDLTERAYNDPEWDIRDLQGSPIPDDDLPFQRVRRAGEPLYGVKHTIQWPDGSRKTLLVNGAPLFDTEGAVERVVFSLTDITDQQEREQELTKAQRRLELALEATNTGVWEWNLETDKIDWSETLERTLGLEVGEFEGSLDAFTDRVHPDDLPRIQAEMERARESDSMYQAEFRMRHEDGSVRWAAARGQLVHDEGTDRMVGIHHDITERKERERELKAMERRLEAILENTTTPMFMKNRDGEYVLVNRGYRELFGLEDEVVIGRTGEEIHGSETPTEVKKNDRAVIEDGEPVEVEERIQVGGEQRVFLSNKVPVYDIGKRADSDAPVAVFGVATDITERERRKRELQRQNERLEKFASVVSHDLRGPLRVAEGRLELLQEEYESVHLDSMGDALSRIDRLIDDVLWLAREGQDIGATKPVSLRKTVDAAWEMGTGDSERAELVVAGGSDASGFVQADEKRLQQLLENLFRNATEHAGTDATVTVGRLDGGFYVEDDGPGIAPDRREAVFEAGYSTNEGGTGFGLQIVEQIVDAHGWEIRVGESQAGGARFEITGVEFAQ
jgi:PAS domain S-box-containing protein